MSRVRLAEFALFVAAAVACTRLAFGDEPSPTRAVTGRITDEAGRPIARADVWLPLSHEWSAGEPRVVHATSDADGRYTLEFSSAWLGSDGETRPRLVWALANGYAPSAISAEDALERIEANPDAPPDDGAEVIDLVLDAPASAEVVVRGPDGSPVAGARVAPWMLESASAKSGPSRVPTKTTTIPPSALREALSAITDAAGRAVLTSAPPHGRLHGLQIEAEGFGVQTLSVAAPEDKASAGRYTVQLRPAGRVEGRVIADRPEYLQGAVFVLGTSDEAPTATRGQAIVRPDASGRFVAPSVAVGKLHCYMRIDEKLTVRPLCPSEHVVNAGETTAIEIPLRHAVLVRGTVRRQDDRRPLAARFDINQPGTEYTWGKTDAEGRFSARFLPGKISVYVTANSPDVIHPRTAFDHVVPEAHDDTPFDLPPIELAPARVIVGRVVDSRNKPVVGQRVMAMIDGRYAQVFTDSNEEGQFTLGGLPLAGEVSFQLSIFPWEVRLIADAADSSLLRTPDDFLPAANVHGRVVDAAGAPVIGAAIEVQFQAPYVFESGDSGSRSGTLVRLVTDDDGAFRATIAGEAVAKYRAVVHDGQSPPALGEYQSFTGDTTDLGTIVVDRLIVVEGRVVDARGVAVPNAVVQSLGNRTTDAAAPTDADGRFRLELAAETQLLFVESPDWPYQGWMIDPSTGPVELTLNDAAALAAVRLADRAARPALPARRALARRALGDYAQEALAGPDEAARSAALRVLTRLDPAAAWEKVQAADPVWSHDAVRVVVSNWLLSTNPQEAWLAASAIESPSRRREQFLTIVDSAIDADMRRRLLAELLLDARSSAQPDQRLFGLVEAARRLQDLNQTDAARAALDEALALARELDGGQNRPSFVTFVVGPLARIDLPRAQELIAEVADPIVQGTMRGNAAVEVAGSNPDAAEELLRSMAPLYSGLERARIARRLAATDVDRARVFLTDIKDRADSAMALGMMAGTAADEEQARELLTESFAALADEARDPQDRGFNDASTAERAAWLLATVEQREPAQLDEFVFRAIALRWRPRASGGILWRKADELALRTLFADAGLACLIAPYNRPLARAIAEPVFDGIVPTVVAFKGRMEYFEPVWTALAAVDAPRAIELIERLPMPPDLDPLRPRNQARLAIARAVLMDDAERNAFFAEKRGRLSDLVGKE